MDRTAVYVVHWATSYEAGAPHPAYWTTREGAERGRRRIARETWMSGLRCAHRAKVSRHHSVTCKSETYRVLQSEHDVFVAQEAEKTWEQPPDDEARIMVYASELHITEVLLASD